MLHEALLTPVLLNGRQWCGGRRKRFRIGTVQMDEVVRKRWNDSVKDCLKKRGLDEGQAKRWYMIRMNGRDL